MSNQNLPVSSSLADVLHAACAKVSPVWPLERFVAVNPYFGMRDQDFETVAQTLADVAGVRSTMPRDFYARALAEGRMRAEDVEAAAEAAGLDADALLASLDAAGVASHGRLRRREVVVRAGAGESLLGGRGLPSACARQAGASHGSPARPPPRSRDRFSDRHGASDSERPS